MTKAHLHMALVVFLLGCTDVPPSPNDQSTRASTGIAQWVRFDIEPNHVEEFRNAALASLKKSLEEPGNLEMRLYVDPLDSSVLFVFSRWKDAAAIDYHGLQPHTHTLKAVIGRTARTPPDARRIVEFD